METARVIELYQREQGYGIFQVNEYDVVSAESRHEAITWYQRTTGIPRHKINPIELGLDDEFEYVDHAKAPIRSVTYRQLIQEAVKDRISFPCIIATYDWEQYCILPGGFGPRLYFITKFHLHL